MIHIIRSQAPHQWNTNKHLELQSHWIFWRHGQTTSNTTWVAIP